MYFGQFCNSTIPTLRSKNVKIHKICLNIFQAPHSRHVSGDLKKLKLLKFNLFRNWEFWRLGVVPELISNIMKCLPSWKLLVGYVYFFLLLKLLYNHCISVCLSMFISIVYVILIAWTWYISPNHMFLFMYFQVFSC